MAWHEPYEDPDSYLSARLAEVQRQLARALEECAPGPIGVLSLCAGQGRDLLGVLSDHPRAGDVSARLVELDAHNAAFARALAARLGLVGVQVLEADAGNSDAFEGAVPADIVMVCGVFGNISENDIARTISFLPTLCAEGARVIWTRHRREPDATSAMRAAFERVGFVEEEWSAPSGFSYGVGTHRLASAPGHFVAGRRLFAFLDEPGSAT